MDRLEDAEQIREYAITITLRGKDHGFTPRRQLKGIYSGIFKLLKRCCHYEIYPELTLNGRLHFHGIIAIFDMVKWNKSVLPTLQKVYGFLLIKKIDNIEKWRIYILKDIDKMKKVLDINLPLINHNYKEVYDILYPLKADKTSVMSICEMFKTEPR